VTVSNELRNIFPKQLYLVLSPIKLFSFLFEFLVREALQKAKAKQKLFET